MASSSEQLNTLLEKSYLLSDIKALSLLVTSDYTSNCRHGIENREDFKKYLENFFGPYKFMSYRIITKETTGNKTTLNYGTWEITICIKGAEYIDISGQWCDTRIKCDDGLWRVQSNIYFFDP